MRWILLPVVVALVALPGGAGAAHSGASQGASPRGHLSAPAASHMAFAALAKEPLGYLGDLFVVRTDGRDLHPLRLVGARDFWDETSPAWSPDGRRIAFSLGEPLINASAIQFSPYSAELAIVDAAGGRVRVITTTEAGVIDDSPSWSPDGRSLAFVRTAAGNGSWSPGLGVYVVATDGTHLRRVLERDGVSGVDWSPDGRSLAFVTAFLPGRVGILELSSGRVEESRSRRPTDVSWAPDGGRLALASDQGVSIVTPRGKVLRRIAGGCCATHVSWSPDGTRIAFSAGTQTAPYRAAVYVVDADGRHVRRIAAGRSSYAPAWQPG
jgi:Tol biopolymer transport system component